MVQVTNKKRHQLQESQESSSLGEVIDEEPEELLEENLVDEEEEEEEEEESHLERAVLALDLADRGSERGVEQFDVVLPQPRKERRRWEEANYIQRKDQFHSQPCMM